MHRSELPSQIRHIENTQDTDQGHFTEILFHFKRFSGNSTLNIVRGKVEGFVCVICVYVMKMVCKIIDFLTPYLKKMLDTAIYSIYRYISIDSSTFTHRNPIQSL